MDVDAAIGKHPGITVDIANRRVRGDNALKAFGGHGGSSRHNYALPCVISATAGARCERSSYFIPQFPLTFQGRRRGDERLPRKNTTALAKVSFLPYLRL